MDYYSKEAEVSPDTIYEGIYDIRDNADPDTDPEHLSRGTYAPHVWQARAEAVVRAHVADPERDGLFLLYALHSVHSPMQAPPQPSGACDAIADETRRTYCEMVFTVNESVEKVDALLHETQLVSNSIVVFSADNGGDPRFGGHNVPLRGQKGSVFEVCASGPGLSHTSPAKCTASFARRT
eukprot:COSAG01_NODE_13625_length_1557_cov_1.412209_1_plen_181_part_00